MADTQPPSDQDIDRKNKPSETQPLLPQASSSANPADRPRTVRHHRRALSGRSTRSGLSGHISFGPSYHPNIYPSINDPFTRQAKQAADGRARTRFLKALLVGIALWIVIGLVFGWAGLHRAGWGQGNNRIDYGAKPSVPRSEGRPVWCATFDPPQPAGQFGMPGNTLKSKATFSIPLAQDDSFFIHGQGSFAKGRISIGTTDSQSVEIEVTALTNDEALINLMTVCHINNHQAQRFQTTDRTWLGSDRQNVGLGIYTPAPEVGPYPDSDLEFRVQVNLPKNLTSIYQFSVKGDLFAVATTNLSAFSISQFDITTTVAPITIGNIISKVIRINTNNGHIEGFFQVSKKLALDTTNGAITANVALTPPTIAQDSIASSADIHPSVAVDIATINGAVSVNYVEHPVNTKLFSYVQSTNGRAHVEHLPAFEGDFEVETTWGSAEVKGPLSRNDPSGQARTRQKFVKSNRDELGYRLISGIVWWGESDEDTRSKKAHRGHTLVKTTLGSARAIFQ